MARDNVYDPYWEYESEEWERKELNRITEVKNARSRDQETRGSEEISNIEPSGEQVQTRGDSCEGGTQGRIHDSGARTHQKNGKIQKDVTAKKRGIKSLMSRTWIKKKLEEAIHGTNSNKPRSSSAEKESSEGEKG